jgi:hypothetical protein
VSSLSQEYCSAERELLKLRIRFPHYWERTFRKVSDSVAASDKKSADAQKLLCEDETDNNARMPPVLQLCRFDQASG